MVDKVSDLIIEGKIIGWFQGKSELGPRALGHRSILCDPRDRNMKDILNKKVKHREHFRPFAASVLLEKTSDFFNIDSRVLPIKELSINSPAMEISTNSEMGVIFLLTKFFWGLKLYR